MEKFNLLEFSVSVEKSLELAEENDVVVAIVVAFLNKITIEKKLVKLLIQERNLKGTQKQHSKFYNFGFWESFFNNSFCGP